MSGTAEQRVYLTFDDGPDPAWTPRILALLAQAGVQATFFMIGREARRMPALVRRVAAEGHVVGNHTFSHRHPWLLPSAQARREVRDGTRVLSDLLGVSPQLYRPPHGCRRPCMIEEARAQGQRVVWWDRSAVDWGPLSSDARIMRRLARVEPGEVVLMHDGRNRHNRPDQLLEALPALLAVLAQRQLRAMTLGPAQQT